MHSSQNPHEVKFTKQQLDGILGENSWLKQDNAMQRAVNAGLREKISKWQTYAKLLKRELEKKDAEIKEVREKLAKKNKECDDLNEERSAASVERVSSAEDSPLSGLNITTHAVMQMAAVPRGGIVVSVSVVPVPAIERSHLELRGENPLISVLQLFPLFSSSLRNIVLDASSWKAGQGTFIPFQPSYTTRKIQDVIQPLCLPPPPSVLSVNPPEAISSKYQAETNLETENTGVSAIPPSPLKLQLPSSERHEDMSYQPPPTLRVQCVNPITTAPETSASSSSFSMPQVDVSTNDAEDEEESGSGITEGAKYSKKKKSRSRKVLTWMAKFVCFGCCKKQHQEK